MKRLKKILTTLVAVAMTASIAVMPVTASGYTYENEAAALNKLGLYKGVSLNEFDPDLGRLLDRQTGVVMLLRIFGQEEDAKGYTEERADSILSKFRDSDSIADWAKRQVAYAVERGYVKGYLEDSTFRPTNALNGKAYCSLILQQLGYNGDFQYDRAASKLSEVGGLTALQGNLFNSDTGLKKDSLVGISYGALKAKYKSNGEKLIEKLVKKNIVSAKQAKEAGFNYAKVVSVESVSDITVNIGVTPKLPSSVKATYDDGTKENVRVNWQHVDTSRAGEKTVTGSIDGTLITASVKVIVIPDKQSVSAVSAGNLKEVLIKFSKPVENEDEAEKKSNYDVDDNSILNADLSDDKMTVTLLLKDALRQQSDVEVNVDEEVGLDEDEELFIENIKDVTTPKVVEVVAAGNALLEVTFSEPVQNATSLSSYRIDDRLFGSSQPKLSDDEKTVTFDLSRDLSSGSHTLTVKDKIEDYAGYRIEDNETRFAVADDDRAPTAEIKSASQTKVVIRFSEKIEKPNYRDVDTNTNSKIDKMELDDDNKTLTIYYDVENALPAAGCRITLEDVSDFSGNSDDITLTVTPDYDVERPEYVGYTIENQKEIVLEFDEEVFSKYGKFKLIDDDDDEIYLSDATYYKDGDEYVKSKLVLKRADSQEFESGEYELSIREVTDLNPLKNEIIDETIDIDVDDKTPPDVSSVYINEEENQVYIKFNEEVDERSATKFTNYYYTVDNLTYDLDDDNMDIDLLSDDKTVCISFPFDEDDYDEDEIVLVNKISRIQVESVEDDKGNEMSAKSIPSRDFKANNSNAPVITSASVTDKNTIVAKVNGSINVNTLEPDDFYITAGKDHTGRDIVITAWDAIYDSDEDEITLNINADIESDGRYNGNSLYLDLEDAEDVDTTNIFKQKLTIHSPVRVSEDFKPVAKSIDSAYYKRGEGTVVFIELSENLRLNHGNQLDNNDLYQFRVKADGDTVEAKIYYYNADREDNRDTDVDETCARFKVVINENYSGDDVQVIFYRASKATIVDGSGNALDDFDFTKRVE